MKKKIITLLLTFFVIVVSAYMIWFYVAKKQEKILLESINRILDQNIKKSDLKTSGFPYRFFTEMKNVNIKIRDTYYNILIPKANILRMVYHLRKFIILIDKPIIKSDLLNSLYFTAQESKVSLSGDSISDKFKVISEISDINIKGTNKIEIANIKQAMVALRDRSRGEIEFFLKLDKIRLGENSNDFIQLNREIVSNLSINGSLNYESFSPQSEKLNFEGMSIIIEAVNFMNEFLKLNCELRLYLTGNEIYTNKEEKCFLQISPKIFNLISTNNLEILKFIYLIKTFVNLKLLTNQENFIEIPFFISVNNNIIYINRKNVFELNF